MIYIYFQPTGPPVSQGRDINDSYLTTRTDAPLPINQAEQESSGIESGSGTYIQPNPRPGEDSKRQSSDSNRNYNQEAQQVNNICIYIY